MRSSFQRSAVSGQPRALDLFCSAGGATRGLQLAGFHVTGVDIAPQPRYVGDAFIQANALDVDLEGYDFIWASPPCQAFTMLRHMPTAHKHPNLIPQTRRKLVAAGVPWVIENVPGAPLGRSGNLITLCGSMFNLGIPEAQLWRHRIFESNIPLFVDRQCSHRGSPVGVYGGGGDNRRFGVVTITGHTGGTRKRGNLQQYNVAQRSRAMGIDWMTNAELSQAIPPAYSRFIGQQVMAALALSKKAA